MVRISAAPPPDDVAVVLAVEGAHGPVIHAANRAARQAGAAPGARVVDVKAVLPDMRVEYADVGGDRRALTGLVFWARRWCPWTAEDGADGLILETTGSDHLYGGEASMLAEIEGRFALAGITARLAVAPTWGAAWALARFGPVRPVCGAQDVALQLAPVPVTGLRLDDETGLLLRRLGLKTIGDLARAPRLSLTRRFARAAPAANPVLRLDQAMGRVAEPVSSVAARPAVQAETRLAEPIQDPTAHLPELCDDVCAQLAQRGEGCRSLRLTVFRVDGEISTIEAIVAAPSRESDHLRRLFDDKLEQIDPGFGFDLITLEAGGVEPITVTQTRLDGDAEADVHLPRLIDRLTARLGERAVRRPLTRASHVPERALRDVSALRSPIRRADKARPPGPIVRRERPLRLLATPEEVRVLYAVPEGPPAQFVWRRRTHRVARYEGPERIAPEWWKDRHGARLRDYFKVEDHSGLRLWMYREGLHEDGRGGPPRWFMHGMFP